MTKMKSRKNQNKNRTLEKCNFKRKQKLNKNRTF